MTDRLTPGQLRDLAVLLFPTPRPAMNDAANWARVHIANILSAEAARREAEARPVNVAQSVMGKAIGCEREGPGSAAAPNFQPCIDCSNTATCMQLSRCINPVKPAPAADLVPMQGPGHPMKCLLCGGKTEEYCGPVIHHVDCKHYVAPDPNARKMTADEIDALMGFDKPAPAGNDKIITTDMSAEQIGAMYYAALNRIEAQAREIERLTRSRDGWEADAGREMQNRDFWKARADRLAAALKSIADNTCCTPCREAGLVAARALASEGGDRGKA